MRFSVIVAIALVNFAAARYIPRGEPDSEFVADPAETNTRSLVARRGTQHIGGICGNDAQCASGCCGFSTGKCAGAIVAQVLDHGCGHGGAHPVHKIRDLSH